MLKPEKGALERDGKNRKKMTDALSEQT